MQFSNNANNHLPYSPDKSINMQAKFYLNCWECSLLKYVYNFQLSKWLKHTLSSTPDWFRHQILIIN